ncbi:MAG: type I-E CRISPR-associated protein Cas6/Cse3/CasE [Rubrivivax sp.]|nr:type I-E CRISPR-associated protein Cas6/Cse3/CasE [Rubrivivax sp.]
MFLSRLTLDPAHPHARRDLASAYEMHRSLARAFAPDADTAPARFLWRLEPDRSGLPGNTVLVQAAQPGQWQALTSQAGYLLDLQANKSVATERLVQPGQHCRFRLLANPTVTRAGKRYGLHDEAARLAWLQRQGQRHGFALLAAERAASGRISAAQGARHRHITLDAVLFEGVLQATDAAAVRQALVAGIGPGKALGLGMLSLAPMPAVETS